MKQLKRAAELGGINCLYRSENSVKGVNTDILALKEIIGDLKLDYSNLHFIIFEQEFMNDRQEAINKLLHFINICNNCITMINLPFSARDQFLITK